MSGSASALIFPWIFCSLRTIVAEISPLGLEVARHSWFYELDTHAFRREVSSREIFEENSQLPPLPLVIELELFQSLP